MRVSRSEARLLTVARGLLEGAPADVLGPMITGEHDLAPSIGPTAERLLTRLLARGAVRVLVRGGGWRRETRPDGADGVVTGRLWQRVPVPGLAFTGATRQLLVALTSGRLANGWTSAIPLPGSGDALLGLLAARLLEEACAGAGIDALDTPLVHLGYGWRSKRLRRASLDTWVAQHGWLIEGVQDPLAGAVVAGERSQARVRVPREALAMATRQGAVLDAFLGACERLGRRDLGDFLLIAGERLIADDMAEAPLGSARLDPRAPLSERVEAQRRSGALLDALIRLQRGILQDRDVRFFDDGHDAAQARLARWERFGDGRFTAVLRRRARLDAPEPIAG